MRKSLPCSWVIAMLSTEGKHPTANGSRALEDGSHGSGPKGWWKCKKGPDHQWHSPILSRTGKGRYHCPFCIGKRVSVNNSLKLLFPEIAKQWHPTANGSWTPADFARGSEAKVWWKCQEGPDHEWQSPIYSRTGKGRYHCPFCIGKRVSVTNSLKSLFPEIARQWHPTANDSRTPADFVHGSEAKVWWKCKEGPDHEWLSPIYSRTRKGRHHCPFCIGKRLLIANSVKSLFPEIAKQWHPKLNGNLKPTDVTAHSNRIVWWICPRSSEHAWQTSVKLRTSDRGCPFCAHARSTESYNLKSLFPHVAKEWHPKKNRVTKSENVMPNSRIQAWWVCPKASDHQWQATPANRTARGSGCPFCAGKKASSTNSLVALFPRIARQWHKTKNKNLRPNEVTGRSGKNVWWQCKSGHSWKQAIGKRTTRTGKCPKCRLQKITLAVVPR